MPDSTRPVAVAVADVDLGRLVRAGTAMAVAASGLIHLDAAGGHRAHAHVAAFFVLLGTAQLAAAGLLVWRPGRAVRHGLAAATLAVIALWVVSRTTGVPFVPDVGAAEAVTLKDAMATALGGFTLAGLGLLAVLPAGALAAVVPAAGRALVAMAASVLALTVPGVVAAHGDDHRHTEAGDHGVATGAHVHAANAAGELAAAHAHGGDGVVASGEELVGHGHSGDLVHASAHHAPISPAVEHAHDGTHDHAVTVGGPGATAAAWHAPDIPDVQGIAATVRYGPFTLPPASSDEIRKHNGLLTNVILTNLERPCSDCYLTMMEPDLVYADGREANYDTGAMLHHNVLAQSWYDDPTCGRDLGIGMAGRRFFASGNERTTAVMPRGYGVQIDQSPWTGIFEIMNHRDVPQTVWFQLHVRYLPASTKGIEPVTPVWLDVDNCGDSQFAVGAGRTVTNWDWTSTITGRVVLTAGHVHDGGVSIELANATSGQSMCRSVAGYGTKAAYMGAIESMSVCAWDRVGVVRAGETLRISALYDTPEALPDVMGIMVVFVYETDDLAGGTDAPAAMTHPAEGAPPAGSGHGGHGH